MKTIRLHTLLLAASALAASSCQTTQVERGRGAEDAVGSSYAYQAQRNRVRLAEVEVLLREGRATEAREMIASLPEQMRGLATHLLLAETFIADGDLAAARLTLDEASQLAEATTDANLPRLQAMVAELSGDWQGAADAWQAAAVMDPHESEYPLGRARALLAGGDLQTAANYLERESAARPESAEIAAATGHAYLALGSHRQAVNHYTRASVMRPNDPAIERGLVLSFSLGGYHNAALARAEHLDAETFDQAMRLSLGRSALLDGQADRAIDYLGAYLDLDERDPSAWLDLARANYMLGRLEPALSALQKNMTLGHPTPRGPDPARPCAPARRPGPPRPRRLPQSARGRGGRRAAHPAHRPARGPRAAEYRSARLRRRSLRHPADPQAVAFGGLTMRRGARQAGFSMLELVIVLVLIGMLIAMGVPRIGLAREEARLDGAVAGLNTLWTAQRLYRLQYGTFADNFDDLKKIKVVQLGFTGGSHPYTYEVLAADVDTFRLRARRTQGGAWSGQLVLQQDGVLTGSITNGQGDVATP